MREYNNIINNNKSSSNVWRCLRTMYIMKFIFKSMLKHSPVMSDEDIIDA